MNSSEENVRLVKSREDSREISLVENGKIIGKIPFDPLYPSNAVLIQTGVLILLSLILIILWVFFGSIGEEEESLFFDICCFTSPFVFLFSMASPAYMQQNMIKNARKKEKTRLERERKKTQRQQYQLEKIKREKLLKKANLLGFNSIESYNQHLAEKKDQESRRRHAKQVEENKKMVEQKAKKRKEEIRIFEQRIKELKSRITERENAAIELRNGVTNKRLKEKAFARHNFQPNHGKISVSKKNDVWRREGGTCSHCEHSVIDAQESDCIKISLCFNDLSADDFERFRNERTLREDLDDSYSHFLIVEEKKHADIIVTTSNIKQVISILNKANIQDDYDNQYLLNNPHSVNEVSFYWTIHPELQVLLLCDSCATEEGLLIDNENQKIKKRSRSISSSVKQQVWQRDEGKCVECGAVEELEFDHIIPHSKGGSNGYNNIQLLCTSCNSRKSDYIE